MSFKSQVAAINKRTQKKMLRTFRGTALGVFSRVIARTPVDTGRLRANWQSQINSAPGGEIDGTDKTGGSTLTTVSTDVSKVKLGDSIFLVNNLPYAQVIEDGSSEQAPAGMVKVTVAEYQAIAKRANK